MLVVTAADLHERPSGDLIKVWFKFVPREGWLPYDTEGLWATQLSEDTARVENLPFLQDGIAQGDVVRFQPDEGGCSGRRAGCSRPGTASSGSCRLTSGPLGPSGSAVHAAFARFGLGAEVFSAELPFVAIDVPADADFALFLTGQRGKNDWAVVEVHDVEAFLATAPKARHRRLTVLRQFFRFAHRSRLILIDPTTSLKAKQENGFRGLTLTLQQQRQLFHRWTSSEHDVHPHEALVGMLALLHAASSQEARLLKFADIDHARCSVRLDERPHPVPLDPATWAALLRCLDHRAGLNTANPHVIVTKGTKAGRTPASTAYLSHVLDACGHPPRAIRCTRLVDLVNTLDPKLVATALGMHPQAPLIYLADAVDPTRMPDNLEKM